MPRDERPNILFIMTDDHASHAMSCYGSRINETPHMDRIAREGTRFDNCFCTNSICAPSRAVILTGTHTHINGVTTLTTKFDGRQTTFPKLLQAAGYQTAIVGKWHLGIGGVHDPTGFDYWRVLPGQGLYHDPIIRHPGGERVYPGYATDTITDLSLDWLRQRDASRPFMLLCHHKAPHRRWHPDAKHARMYEDVDIPEPDTLFDDYSDRSRAAREAEMRVSRDLNERDVKGVPPEGLSPEDRTRWFYQRYIKDYLRCIASVDDNIGRMLDYLDAEGLTENTIVVYTSDQGFFLGDHGWYDKRFMYEESLRMPLVMRYPRAVAPGSVSDRMVLNLDFAQTFLDFAGVEASDEMQGRSFRPILEGEAPEGWRTSMYYRYWMHLGGHNVCAHWGIRTERYKLIYYYGRPCGQPGAKDEEWEPEWELFDLEKDPAELHSVHDDPAYAVVATELKAELRRLKKEAKDHDDAGLGGDG